MGHVNPESDNPLGMWAAMRKQGQLRKPSELEKQAYAEGKQAAENAASWIVDGNTADEVARSMLRQLREGDPASDSWMPAPNLSGEMADDPTPLSLARDLTGDEEIHPDLIDQLADAWEEGCGEHIEAACEAELIRFVGPLLAGMWPGTQTITFATFDASSIEADPKATQRKGF